jgi:hypothetical protein
MLSFGKEPIKVKVFYAKILNSFNTTLEVLKST